MERLRAARDLCREVGGARRVVRQARPQPARDRADRGAPARRGRQLGRVRRRRREPPDRGDGRAVRPRSGRGAARRVPVVTMTETPRLLPPGSGAGFLGELAVPAELYWVVRRPAPLAGMSYPRGRSWE